MINVRDAPDTFQASLHELRESWRCHLFNSWLHSERRDGAVARNVGRRYDEVKILHLRRLIPTLTGDEAAVAVGGMSTPATCAAPPLKCPYCNQGMWPSLHHVLWDCQAFQYLRDESLPVPISPLAARLGWDLSMASTEAKRLLQQMGKIRAVEAQWRRRGRHFRP